MFLIPGTQVFSSATRRGEDRRKSYLLYDVEDRSHNNVSGEKTKSQESMEPGTGLEPVTYGLQNRCSTN